MRPSVDELRRQMLSPRRRAQRSRPRHFAGVHVPTCQPALGDTWGKRRRHRDEVTANHLQLKELQRGAEFMRSAMAPDSTGVSTDCAARM